MTNCRHQTREEGMVQSLANGAAGHRGCWRKQTHHEARTSEGLGVSYPNRSAPPPGRQVTGRRRHGLGQQRPVSQSQGLIFQNSKYKTEQAALSGIKPPSGIKPFIRHQAQLNGRSLPDPENPVLPRLGKGGKWHICPGRPRFRARAAVHLSSWVTGEETEAPGHKTPHLKPHTERG